MLDRVYIVIGYVDNMETIETFSTREKAIARAKELFSTIVYESYIDKYLTTKLVPMQELR